jgi:2-haloacid dehalogenase
MVIVFDLNGTLLDTSALAPEVRAIFGEKVSVEEWLNTTLEHAMALTLAKHYRDFEQVAIAVLKMIAAGKGIVLSPERIQRARAAMLKLPPFREVEPALKKLRKAGFKLAVLTNSSRPSLAQKLHNAGLREYFDQTLSVDSVGVFKPATEVYTFAAETMLVDPSDLLMVAAHHWDLLGAQRAGCKTAFLERPGKALLPGELRPDYVAKDLKQLANQLIQQHPAEVKPSRPWWPIAACGLALTVAALTLAPGLRRTAGDRAA